MINKEIAGPIAFDALVVSCEKTEKGLTFVVSDVHVQGRRKNFGFDEPFEKSNRLHLTWKGKKALISTEDYSPGTKVSFLAILSPIYGQAFPGAYDFKKQLYFKKIAARGFIIRAPVIEKASPKQSLLLFMDQLRHKIDQKISTNLSTNPAAIAKALITGNKAEISKQIRSYFANSGIAHILAISGLHMGIIGFFIFWLLRILLCCILPISMYYNTKKIAACLSWIVVLLYLFISGCSVPSIRAFIMHTLIMAAILLDRTALTMRSVAIAATIIMLLMPEVILFPSFQMSFGAVIAIVAFYERELRFPVGTKWLANVMLTTVIASIPTTLFSVSVFNQLTLNSILANVIAIPLMGFVIMPTTITALFFMIFDAARPMLLLLEYCLDLLIKIAEKISQLPGSFFVMQTPSSTVMAILILSGLLITLLRHRINRIGFVGIPVGVAIYFLQPTADIFLAPNAKTIGIKTNTVACFNHLGYFRSIGDAWTKSVGLQKRERFDSKACRKYISQVDKHTYVAHIKNRRILIKTDAAGVKKIRKNSTNRHGRSKSKYATMNIDDDLMLFANRESNKCSEVIFLPSKRKLSTDGTQRPWS
jgi:competence protein ComEC